MVNYKLLRNGAIYRISYSTWITNERPIVYLIYASPFKLHGLSLNGPNISTLDIKRFAYFLKLARKTKNWSSFNGRIVYRILKTYFRDLVKKTYRTYIVRNVAGYSLVNTGTVPKEQFTSYETAHQNAFLYNQSKLDTKLQELNRDSKSGYIPPKKPNIYNPQVSVPIIQKDKVKIEPIETKSPTLPSNTPDKQSDYFSIYDED